MRVLRRTVTATSEEQYTVQVDLSAGVGGLYAGGGLTTEGATWPAPEIEEPAPLQSCIDSGNHLTYYYTVGGTHGALGNFGYLLPTNEDVGQFSSSLFTQYISTGGNQDAYPHAGLIGTNAGGINFCTYSDGGIDYLTGGAGFSIRFTVVGPGTLSATIVSHPLSSPPACTTATTMSLTTVISGTAFSYATDSGAAGTLSTDVPDDGYCAHYVTLSTNGSFGFVSATWSP